MNELALWVGGSAGASVDLEGYTLAAFWVAQNLMGKPMTIQRPGRRLTRDELAWSVNQDVMLTGVVRDETKPVRPCRDRGLPAALGVLGECGLALHADCGTVGWLKDERLFLRWRGGVRAVAGRLLG